MASSSSYELTLQAEGKAVAALRAGPGGPPASAGGIRLRPDRPALLSLRAPPGSRVRARLGPEVILELPEGGASRPIDLLQRLPEEFGEVEVVLEEPAGPDADSWRTTIRLKLEVLPTRGVEEMFEAIVRELEEAHVGLAQDLLGRTARRSGAGGRPPRAIRPQEDLTRLEEIWARLDRSLRRIGLQPSLVPVRAVRRETWKAGDRCDARTALDAARSGFRLAGQGAGPGKVLVSRRELTADIEEHRHLREGIGRMARWSDGLASFCRRSADLLEDEEDRWGGEVFEERYLPRIRWLDEIRARAAKLAGELRRAAASHEFLSRAGAPRSPFGPTPIFQGRDAYREAYLLLREALSRLGVQVDAEGAVKARFKRFSTLYEYWCFIRVVLALRERFGAPEGGAFRVIDEVYRPELEPGQSFRFRLPGRVQVIATYEPEFPPAAARGDSRFVAALVTGPLRPDVVVEVRREDHPPVMMALDAKSTRSFTREALWSLSDYRGLIHDPRTGHQPVRQLFLLHADAAARPVANLTGYLKGDVAGSDASILGAVPCVPGDLRHLGRVLDRFLDLWIIR